MVQTVFIHIKLISIFLLLPLMASAQQPKSEFRKTVDSVNAILKANKLAYYTDHKQISAFIREISINKMGIITFKDSIPPSIKTNSKTQLISDCCPTKTVRTIDLGKVKKWDIQFPYTYLKDKNNQTYGRIIGIRKADLYKLKEQFGKLTALNKK